MSTAFADEEVTRQLTLCYHVYSSAIAVLALVASTLHRVGLITSMFNPPFVYAIFGPSSKL